MSDRDFDPDMMSTWELVAELREYVDTVDNYPEKYVAHTPWLLRELLDRVEANA